ncbi:DUF3696 domain-containing protein [Burkholderia sp.]|uniref:AAA family ATPase n=1 Tax=Burkholderia sp. TaxID=36773 RepID=UPI00283AB770|nr:DUF3696 domain-containing protein [Burkholderia sp.]
MRLVGFKAFKDKSISLGKLTVLAGLNNSGKSSFMQAVRMSVAGQNSESPYIDGLGGFSALKSSFTAPGEPILIELNLSDSTTTKLELKETGFEFQGGDGAPFTQFISADRYGPRVQLPIMREDAAALTVGIHGEFSAYYASVLENIIVAEPLRHPNSASATLKHQLSHWMGEISPGVKLNFEVERKYDSSYTAIDDLRPTNSGFGISYVLPIVLCILTMSGSMGDDDSDWRVKEWFALLNSQKSLLLIENPEAHLHPRGQTVLGRLITIAAASGIQTIVETHSDHVLDGIRLATKHDPGVTPTDVQIKYFKKSSATETDVSEIKVLDDGRLDHWPEGFFDQMSVNLRALSSKK